MKAYLSGGSLALALLLAGCGDGAEENAAGNTAAGGETAAPLQQVEAPNGDWTQVVTQTEEGGFLMGNPNAPVKLVEYASMTCPHCATFSQQGSEELKNKYVKSGQVSFEFRNFVLNPVDLAATMLVRCQGTGPYFRLTEQLFADQQGWTAGFQNIDEAESQRISALPREQQMAALSKAGGLDAFFRQRGVPEQKINSCLADQQAVQRLVEMNEVAVKEHNIQGTPSFLINGELVQTAADWKSLEPQLKDAIG